jgi:hypothetical protein
MSKEHAGGAIPSGFASIPVEWTERHCNAIPISSFDYSALDNLTSECQEALDDGRPIEPILKSWELKQRMQWMAKGAAEVLAEIVTASDIRKAACAWSYVCGLDATQGTSGPALASQFGITKQAFFQYVDQIAKRLGGMRRLNMRDDSARDKMRTRNFRGPR